MKISNCKFFCENIFFCSALAALLGYGVGWLSLAFPMVLCAATLLLVFIIRQNKDMAAFAPPGMFPLLLLAGLSLVQLIPLPPLVLKFIFPETWRLYGETIWLAVPGAWMPVSVNPKATLNAFFFLALHVVVYLLTANLLRVKRRLEKIVATLMIFAAMTVIIAGVLQVYPSVSAIGQAQADVPVWPAGSSGMFNLQALLVTILPVLLIFAGYQFSLLRHYTLREKISEIFSRQSLGFSGLGTSTISLTLLCIYIIFRFAPVFCAVSAAALIFCGLLLLLNRRRRALSWPAFSAAFFFGLAAILAGDPNVQKTNVGPESNLRTGLELGLLSHADAAADLLLNFPVLGTGLGTAQRVRSRLADDVIAQEEITDPADFVVGSGLVGVALGVWFLVSLLRRIIGRRKEQKSRLADCLLAGCLAGLLAIASLSVLGLLPAAGSLWAISLVGLAVAISSQPGVKEGSVAVTASISPRTLNSSAAIAVLVVGIWVLSVLGAKGGRSLYPEAWQMRERWEEINPDPAAAASRARSAGMLDPLEGRYPFAHAELLQTTGNFPAARRQFVAALRRDPSNGKFLQALGGLEAREGDKAHGEQLILAGLRDRSMLTDRQEFYARWLVASARTAEAMQVVREGLTRNPGQTRSFLQMMILEGIPLRELRQALPNRSGCFIDYADYQRESGDPRGAGKNYQHALGLALGEMDADPSIFWRLYRYFSGEGNDEAALTALQAGLRLFPLHPELRRLSAETYQRLGLHSRAAEEYRKTLLTDPDDQKATQGLQELAAE